MVICPWSNFSIFSPLAAFSQSFNISSQIKIDYDSIKSTYLRHILLFNFLFRCKYTHFAQMWKVVMKRSLMNWERKFDSFGLSDWLVHWADSTYKCQLCAGVRLSATREAWNTPASHQAEERASPPATLMASEKFDNKIEKHYKYI